MNHELSWKVFVYWIIAGMGLRVGWGLIELLVDVAKKAVG